MAGLLQARRIAYYRDSRRRIRPFSAGETAVKAVHRLGGGITVLQLGGGSEMHRYASIGTEAADPAHELHGLHLAAILQFEKIGDGLRVRVIPLERAECRSLAVAGRRAAPQGYGELGIGTVGKLMGERSAEDSSRPVPVADLSRERQSVIREDRLIEIECGRVIG